MKFTGILLLTAVMAVAASVSAAAGSGKGRAKRCDEGGTGSRSANDEREV